MNPNKTNSPKLFKCSKKKDKGEAKAEDIKNTQKTTNVECRKKYKKTL